MLAFPAREVEGATLANVLLITVRKSAALKSGGLKLLKRQDRNGRA
jgi:hypothetical protein